MRSVNNGNGRRGVTGLFSGDNLRLSLLLCPGLLLALLMAMPGCRRPHENHVEIIWATNQHHTRSAAIADFEKENPGIHVRIKPISEPRQFFLQCLFGDAPDVITFFQVDMFQSFATNGLLRPLDASGYKPWPFYSGLWDYCFRRGDQALMALPQVAYPYVLFYNKNLVSPSKAGAVKNWDDLYALLTEMMPFGELTGKPVFGLDVQSDHVWFSTWYRQRGGLIFDRDSSGLLLDKAKARDTLLAMARWRSTPGLMPEPKDRLNLPSKGSSQGVLGSLFLQGRALFYWSGSWKICDFVNQSRVEWGVLHLPAGPENNLSLLGGNSFGVSVKSRYPAESERFVRYLGSLEAQKRHCDHQIFMPARPTCPVPERYHVLKTQIAKALTLDYSERINEALLKEVFRQMLEAHRLGLWTSTQAVEALERALLSGKVSMTQ